MKQKLSRRRFVKQTATFSAGLAALGAVSPLRANSPNDKIVVGVMGTNGRGMAHINAFLAVPNVEIGYVCDVDDPALEKAVKAVAARQARAPQGVKDFRRILEDRSVNVLSIAAPNHWHAPATILACSAGKHVYVEKPGSHNPHEAGLMVQAARRNRSVVQMGNQRRSWPWVVEAISKLHAGEIGNIRFARSWYNNARGSIGRGRMVPVPERLDFNLWQGPAPERPYQDNLVHYNWHWFWHWGNGELGNNGVHALDLVRWGMKAGYPSRVTCGGGRYHFQDDQETPDTCVTTFDFGDKGATWEGHSCHPRGFEGAGFGVTFYGDNGSLIIVGNNYKVFDANQKLVHEVAGRGGDVGHIEDFVDCIRRGGTPVAEIEDAQKSAMLCHLGNIAFRTGHTLNIDPQTGRVVGDKAAEKFWRREYRKGWEPKV